MRNNTQSLRSGRLEKDLATVIAGVLALIFLSLLLTTPRPVFTSNQPWKVELLTALFLVVLGLFAAVRWRSNGQYLFSAPAQAVWPQCVPIIALALWSGISMAWAVSPLLAVHHTLVWGIYLSFFVVFLNWIRGGSGIFIITAAFTLIAGLLGLLTLIDFVGIVDFAASEGAIRIRYAKYAEMLVTLLPLVWVATIYVRRRSGKIIIVSAAVLGWIAVMLSLSKGALISGVLGFVMLFFGCCFFSTVKVRKRILALASLWLVVTVAVQVLFSAATSTPSTTDYISGTADKTRSTSAMRVFTWGVAGHMIARHWTVGVGADNFGLAFNAARAGAARSENVVNEEIAEDYIVERAHNEVLQILAELGIIGGIFFLAIFIFFFYRTAIAFSRNRYRLSPALWAAIAGMAAFGASSMVSSFSFRAVQNGIVFFMVFAVAANELRKMPPTPRANSRAVSSSLIPICLILLISVAMVALSASRAAAEYYVYQAERAAYRQEWESLFTTALKYDPTDAPALMGFGLRMAKEGDHHQAAQLLQRSVDRGLGVTLTYSHLAKFHDLAGDAAAAEKTLTEAIRTFPNSVFMRARYAVFLTEKGRPDDAVAQMAVARAIDVKQANGWYMIMTDGSVATYFKAQQDPQTALPADLRPENAVRQFLDDIGP